MTAAIVMNSGSPVTGSIEVAASTPVTLSNYDNTGVLGWKWTLSSKPAGSAAVLSATYNSTCTITPDLPGTYMIQLITYTDATRSNVDDADEQAIGVRYTGSFLWRLPGAGETTQFDASEGWKPELNSILGAIRTQLLADVALARLAFNQTLRLSNGDQIEFDTADVVGTKAAVNTSAGANCGQFTLQAGTWLLLAAVRPIFGSTSDLARTAWYNVSDSAEVGSRSQLYPFGTTSTTVQGNPVSAALVTLAAQKVFEHRIVSLSGTITAWNAGQLFAAALRLQ